MNNRTASFGTLYHPKKAFVVYERKGQASQIYVESYDMDSEGFPINAHPLSIRESIALARSLDISEDLKRTFLKPSGLLPKHVLYINPDQNGYAVWHTPRQRVNLLFVDSLGIPSGKASVPALLWKASKERLYIYALNEDKALSEHSSLYHAPFFNIHGDGKVCMGTVKVSIDPDCGLEGFMQQWQEYFFNSYFSHLIQGTSPVTTSIVQLWKSLVGNRKQFPVASLKSNGLTLKNILS